MRADKRRARFFGPVMRIELNRQCVEWVSRGHVYRSKRIRAGRWVRIDFPVNRGWFDFRTPRGWKGRGQATLAVLERRQLRYGSVG